MQLKSYRELLVWQKGMDLVVESYKIAGFLPKTERYGLKSQIERAAVSVPANIAEGHGRDHLGDDLRHLSVAMGSLMELETHLLIAEKLSSWRQPRSLGHSNVCRSRQNASGAQSEPSSTSRTSEPKPDT